MKKKYLLELFIPLVITGYSAAVFATDGTIKFQGDIVNTPCVVSTASSNQTVQMGQVKSSIFKEKGSASALTPFQIVLEECQLDQGKDNTVSVTFSGTGDPRDPTVVNVHTGQGSADGVGLEILDNQSTKIPLSTLSKAYDLLEGQSVMNFNARYVAVVDKGNVVPGHANATVDFNLLYK